MSAFKVDCEELLDAVEWMQRFEQQLRQAVEDAEQQVRRLHVTWTGAAAEEHREAHARWQRGAEEMHDALSTLRRVARTGHGNYTAAASANSAMWRL